MKKQPSEGALADAAIAANRRVLISPSAAVCPAARLIVEIDSGLHDLSSEQEVSRTRFLQDAGHRRLRLLNNEITVR